MKQAATLSESTVCELFTHQPSILQTSPLLSLTSPLRSAFSRGPKISMTHPCVTNPAMTNHLLEVVLIWSGATLGASDD